MHIFDPAWVRENPQQIQLYAHNVILSCAKGRQLNGKGKPSITKQKSGEAEKLTDENSWELTVSCRYKIE